MTTHGVGKERDLEITTQLSLRSEWQGYAKSNQASSSFTLQRMSRGKHALSITWNTQQVVLVVGKLNYWLHLWLYDINRQDPIDFYT